MKLKMVVWVLSFISLHAYGQDAIKGKVTAVVDGNTIEIVATDNERYKILLHGVDSPEPGQNYAEQARKFLEKILLNKAVTIVIHGKDRHGNRLSEIKVDGSPDPRRELVSAGLAWTSEKEPIAELESLKEEARTSGKGLWTDENPTPPWTYRRQQSMMQLKSSD